MEWDESERGGRLHSAQQAAGGAGRPLGDPGFPPQTHHIGALASLSLAGISNQVPTRDSSAAPQTPRRVEFPRELALFLALVETKGICSVLSEATCLTRL